MRRPILLSSLLLLTACAAAPQRWYKGNLHTHTLWSDGNHFPEMVVDWYAQRNYDFLALTDHNVLADHDKWMQNDVVVRRGGRTALADYRARFGDDWVEERSRDGKLEVRLKRLDEFSPLFESLLLIPAEEVTSSFEKKPIHINATTIASRLEPQRGASVQDVIRKTMRAAAAHAAEHGRPVLAHLNHPNFGWGVSADDIAHVTEERFFEVWNGHPSVHHEGDSNRPGTERLWDIANTTRRRDLDAALLYGLGTDDCHNYHNASGSTPGRGWVMVRAGACTAEALLAAIDAGDFYASSGVVLTDVAFDGRTLKINVEGHEGASYVTEFIGTRRDGPVGEVLARVEGLRPSYAATGDELFVRATVTSSLGADNPVWEGQRRQAWVQPVTPARRTR